MLMNLPINKHSPGIQSWKLNTNYANEVTHK